MTKRLIYDKESVDTNHQNMSQMSKVIQHNQPRQLIQME